MQNNNNAALSAERDLVMEKRKREPMKVTLCFTNERDERVTQLLNLTLRNWTAHD